MTINSVIDSAVESIKAVDLKRKNLSRNLEPFLKKNFNSANSAILEGQIVFPIKSIELNEKICGIDSGFTGKNMYAVDLMLIRTVGAIFSYEKNKLLKAEYFPNIYSFPTPHLSNNSLEKDEFNLSTSLKRLMEETNTAIRDMRF